MSAVEVSATQLTIAIFPQFMFISTICIIDLASAALTLPWMSPRIFIWAENLRQKSWIRANWMDLAKWALTSHDGLNWCRGRITLVRNCSAYDFKVDSLVSESNAVWMAFRSCSSVISANEWKSFVKSFTSTCKCWLKPDTWDQEVAVLSTPWNISLNKFYLEHETIVGRFEVSV